MNSVRNRELRAVEYHRLAQDALTLAAASVLDHVREKHERAAAQWTALADLDERPATGSRLRTLAPDPVPEAGSAPRGS